MPDQVFPSLEGLDDDTLTYIFSFLTIEEILRTRRVSPRLAAISQQLIVWRHALDSHILAKGFPFPGIELDHLLPRELERHVRRARRLSRFWLNPARVPRQLAEFSASSGMGVSDVRFVPSFPGCLISVTRVIWDMVLLWDFSACADRDECSAPTQLAEWACKGALFTGLAINTDPRAEACLAVSMSFSGEQRVEILAIKREGADGSKTRFETVAVIQSTFRAMALQGDVVILSDDVNETHLLDWRTNKHAVLCGSDEPSEHNFQHNRCMQVLCTPHCVTVVRARSFETFDAPPLVSAKTVLEPIQPFSQHAFGWIDGVAVAPRISLEPHCNERADAPPLSILLRAESDDPWADDLHTLDLYVLRPRLTTEPAYPLTIALDAFGNILESAPAPEKGISAPVHHPPTPQDAAAHQSPYRFPPLHVSAYPGTRGHLHCRDMRLGAHGTALWIQPRPAHTAALGLTEFDVHSSTTQGTRAEHKERLVATVTPGAMRECNVAEFGEGEGVRTLRSLDSADGNWMCLDYDEARGLAALGSSRGKVTLLRLE